MEYYNNATTGISLTNILSKRNKRVYALRFHLYKFQQQAKVIYGTGGRMMMILPGLGGD